MLYAIGEIVLVVVGILIALQVNNWNQKQLQEGQIQVLLKKLHNELNYDYSYFIKLDSITTMYRKFFESSLIMAQDGLDEFKIDSITSGSFGFFNYLQTPRNAFTQLNETGFIWKLNSTLDSLKIDNPIAPDGDVLLSLSDLIISYYEIYDWASRFNQDNIVLQRGYRKSVHLGFYRFYMDYRREHSEVILASHQWLFDKNSANYKAMFNYFESRYYYTVNLSRELQKLKAILYSLIREITESIDGTH